MRIALERGWDIGAKIGGGGFGQVYVATCASEDLGPCVAKFVPKVPGAQRELLFVNLPNVRNIVPIIDSGEVDAFWVLVMPRADKSLRQHIEEAGTRLALDAALPILVDIGTALADLDGIAVHRDLKPENVLLLGGVWCLADFGISRYAEASTALDTQKFALSAPYAAPERWRGERAMSAADVYAFGIIGFELFAGLLPFAGPEFSDFREQHLHGDARQLGDVPAPLASLIAECLYKSAGARPSAKNILARLSSSRATPGSAGRARLQQANLQIVAKQGEGARLESAKLSEAEKRSQLLRDAIASFGAIGSELKSTVVEDAPAAVVATSSKGWSARLDGAVLEFKGIEPVEPRPWGGWEAPKFEVIACASIKIRISKNHYGYEGRSHSLWFCDAHEAGRFEWFETAFMHMPLTGRSSAMAPFFMDPGVGAAKALWSGMAEYQLAWPFTPVRAADLSDFLDRWIGWLADASQGRLQSPSMMPERPAEGSWRR
jgi:serine/threonine protein kinase